MHRLTLPLLLLFVVSCTGKESSHTAPLPPPPSIPTPTPLPSKAIAGPIGTDGVLRFVAADENEERWAVYCQARPHTNSDAKKPTRSAFQPEMNLYLNLSAGAGERIAKYLGRDPTLRWILVEYDQSNWLIDSKEGTRKNLGPAYSVDQPKSISPSFNEGGQLLYTKNISDSARFVIHDLETSQETTLASSASPAISTATLSSTADWIFISHVIEDTNEDGNLRNVPFRLSKDPCNRSTSPVPVQDKTVQRILSTKGKELSVAISTQHYDMGENVLIAGEHGGYRQIDASLQSSVIAPPDCDSLHAIDTASQHILVGCTKGLGKQGYVVGQQFSKVLPFMLVVPNPATWRNPFPIQKGEVVSIRGLGDAWKVDLKKGTAAHACSSFESQVPKRVVCEGTKPGRCSSKEPHRCENSRYMKVVALSRNGRQLTIRSEHVAPPRNGPLLWEEPEGEAPLPKPIPLPRCEIDSTGLCVVARNLHALLAVSTTGEVWGLGQMQSIARGQPGSWVHGMTNKIESGDNSHEALWWWDKKQHLALWEGDKWTETHPPLSDIRSTHSSSEKNLWVTGTGRIRQWDGKGWNSIPYPISGSGAEDHFFGEVFTTASNDSWVGAWDTMPWYWNGRKWRQPAITHPLANFWGCAKGDTWASHWGKLFHWNGNQWQEDKTFVGTRIEAIAGSSCTDVWLVDQPKKSHAKLWHWDGNSWAAKGEVPWTSELFVTPKALWISGSGIFRWPLL